MQQTNHPIDTERYSRQILLPEIGLEGQQRLHSASALVIGAGGLGAPPLLYYLTAAGLGHIGIVDDDQVGASNLQRQILFTEADLGLNKALQAAQRLKALNSSTQFEVYPYRLDDTCARTIAERYDLLIDATDNLATRSLLGSRPLKSVAKREVIRGWLLAWQRFLRDGYLLRFDLRHMQFDRIQLA